MSMDYKEKKQNILHSEIASSELAEKIIARIHILQKRRVFWGTVMLSFLTVGSLGSVLYAGSYFIEIATRTGFFQYVSLLFSDGATLISSWKEFLSLLAESIPLAETIFVLVSIGIFVWLLAQTLEKRKITRYAFS